MKNPPDFNPDIYLEIIFLDCVLYFLLTNQAWRPYWEILAQCCGSMDWLQQGPLLKWLRAIIPLHSSVSKVNK